MPYIHVVVDTKKSLLNYLHVIFVYAESDIVENDMDRRHGNAFKTKYVVPCSGRIFFETFKDSALDGSCTKLFNSYDDLKHFMWQYFRQYI